MISEILLGPNFLTTILLLTRAKILVVQKIIRIAKMISRYREIINN